jgi:hypothetical protein
MQYLLDNVDWIFSGIGVIILGYVVNIFFSKKKEIKNKKIVTHGDMSPGNVEGDYKIHVTNKR